MNVIVKETACKTELAKSIKEARQEVTNNKREKGKLSNGIKFKLLRNSIILF